MILAASKTVASCSSCREPIKENDSWNTCKHDCGSTCHIQCVSFQSTEGECADCKKNMTKVQLINEAGNICQESNASSSGGLDTEVAAFEPRALKSTIRRIWNSLQLTDGIESNEHLHLDKDSEHALISEGEHFIRRLLLTFSALRGAKNKKTHQWQSVLQAARVLDLPQGVIQRSQLRLLTKSSSTSSKDNDVQMDDIKKWDVDHVGKYLKEKGLTSLISIFKENAIDGETLLTLSYEDLHEDLGIGDDSAILKLLAIVANLHRS